MAADSKAKFLQEAERLVLQGKIQQAIEEYLKIVKYDSGDVLILNTVGDLYLRQKNTSEANKYFSQVAESYVRDNFLSKAVAVYKKILSTDPSNLQVNRIVASLYARQGMAVDARNHYLRVAALLEKEGKITEALEAYEQVVELDPVNATIQRKVAELQLAHGSEDRAHFHWIGAARALAKTGDLSGAMDCFQRAVQLKPQDVQAMGGLLDCCLEMGNVSPAIRRLEESLALASDNTDMREMLGRAYLAARDLEKAARAFEAVVSLDESRYQLIFPLCRAFIDVGDHDRAANCLDQIIPTLISRRETTRAVEIYELILERCPTHVSTLKKLADLYSAVDDQGHYLQTLDKIAEFYLSRKSLPEALEYLDRILRSFPESEKHRKLHRETFKEAYPDAPYEDPAPEPEPRFGFAAQNFGPLSVPGEEEHSEIVEADLLLNYGLRDKALKLLRTMESRDPYNREVRTRLISIFKEEKKFAEAAEQCLLLAMLHRRLNDEESAQSYLDQARQLSPDVVECEQDLDDFARRNGIVMDGPLGSAADGVDLKESTEVDLSGDLLEIFFTGEERENAIYEESEPIGAAEVNMLEAFPQDFSSRRPARSVQEQLQEVDFYIRLGFQDEALAKLNEIHRIYPRHPELAERYQKLGMTPPEPVELPIEPGSALIDSIELADQEEARTPEELEHRDAFESIVEDSVENSLLRNMPEVKIPAALNWPQPEQPVAMATSRAGIIGGENTGTETALDSWLESPPAQGRMEAVPPKSDFQVNDMFADLIEEVSSLSDQDLAKEAFDEHFNLGTAYHEMELIDEAIEEFEKAMKSLDSLKDVRRIIQCCGMLSTCFLKKGMPRSALRWCQTGLSVEDISSHESMALRYDMALAHSMAGSIEKALECFDKIFATDPSYRDVAKRIDELRASQ